MSFAGRLARMALQGAVKQGVIRALLHSSAPVSLRIQHFSSLPASHVAKSVSEGSLLSASPPSPSLEKSPGSSETKGNAREDPKSNSNNNNGNNNNNNYREWMKGAGGAVIGAVGLFSADVWLRRDQEALPERVHEKNVNKVCEREVEFPISMDEYIDRKDVEAKLKVFVTDSKPSMEGVFGVYGAKGVGKSTTVAHVLKGRRGVTVLHIDNDCNPVQAVAGLFEDVVDGKTRPMIATTTEALEKKVESIIRDAAKKLNHPPIFVFDLVTGTGRDQTLKIMSVCRLLANWNAKCIIVFSDATSEALETTKESTRVKSVFLSAFSEEDANKHLDKQKVFMGDAVTRASIFSSLSTLPLVLDKVAEAVARTRNPEALVTDPKQALEELQKELFVNYSREWTAWFRNVADLAVFDLLSNMVHSKNGYCDLERILGVADLIRAHSNAVLLDVNTKRVGPMTPLHWTAFLEELKGWNTECSRPIREKSPNAADRKKICDSIKELFAAAENAGHYKSKAEHPA